MDPTYRRAKAGRPARTFIQLLCEDTGCRPEDLPGAMNNREKWWERIRDIRDDNDDDFHFKPLAWCVECSPIDRETGVQLQVESYHRLKKSTWYCRAKHSELQGNDQG